MSEVELKMQVPAERRARVEREVAGVEPSRRMRLQASYVDTPDDALAAAGLALRVRREGRQWVQTLKGAAADGMTREEHNVAVPGSGAEVPAPDPALHADTAVGRRLLEVLQAADAPLAVRYGTDIRRRRRIVRVAGGQVELAFDAGHVKADERRWPVLELEIELHAGSPLAVVESARRWIARHGLWLDTRTKAERGGLLAHGHTMAPPTRAAAIAWRRGLSVAQAESAMLNGCLRHVAANASQIASGLFLDQHVHQLRIGLRRLRSGLRLFADAHAPDPLAEAAARWFRQLGVARDAVAMQPLMQEVQQALDAIGLSLPAPESTTAPAEAAIDLAALARDGASQNFMLDAMARAATLATTVAVEGDEPLTTLLSHRLSRWHRHVMAEAKRFDRLDDAARHELRKRVKRLRYAVEFSGDVFEGASQRRYAKRLRRLQDSLGRVTDASTALALWRDGAPERPGNAFAIGWLVLKHEALIAACRPAIERFLDAKRFWNN